MKSKIAKASLILAFLVATLWAVPAFSVSCLDCHPGMPVTIMNPHNKPLTCSDCHVMHNTVDGSPQNAGHFLLIDGDQASKVVSSNDSCLSCHDGTIDVINPDLGGGDYPSGDFGDLDTGAAGYNRGHDMEATLLLPNHSENAPKCDGDSFTVNDFRCASCHDPHKDKDDEPRLIRDGDEIPDITPDSPANAPEAEWMDMHWFINAESDTWHNQYKSGVSAWCANCHSGMDNENSDSDFHHPSGDNAGASLKGAHRVNYGADYKFGVPYEDSDFSNAGLTAGYGPDGASNPTSGNEQIMCLTCHRAHASPYDYGGRWDIAGGQVDWDGSAGTCNACHKK